MRRPLRLSLATGATLLGLITALPGQSGAVTSISNQTPGSAEARVSAAAGVTLVRDNFNYTGTNFPSPVTAAGGMAFFAANERGTDTYTLWRSDGTATGTISLPPETPASGYDGPSDITAVGNIALFINQGAQLWRSDGTRAGTFALPGATVWELRGVTAGNVRFFADSDSNPWRSDGTAAGTYRLLDKGPAPGSVRITEFTASGNTAFWASYYDSTPALWASDGTPSGTRELPLPFEPYRLHSIVAAGQYLYFTHVTEEPAFGVPGNMELWRTDGTEAGTVRLLELTTPSYQSPYIADLTAVGDSLYFTTGAPQQPGASSLWRTDGTAAGTVKISDIGADPAFFTVVGPRLFFSASTPTAGVELWASDGTAAGTGMVADLNPGPDSSDPLHLVAHGGAVYYQNTSGSGDHWRGLWTSDGTAAGTRRVDDLTWQGYSYPHGIASSGADLYFMKDSGGRDQVRSMGLYKLGATDALAARLRASAPKKVRVGKRKVALRVKLSSTAPISVRVSATVKLGSRRGTVKLRATRATVAPSSAKTVRVSPSKAVNRKIQKAVRLYRDAAKSKKRRTAVVARVVVKGTDNAGSTIVIKRKVKLI